MKYLLLIMCSFIFVGCVINKPLKLNVVSPHPINTTLVRDSGDIGININYFSYNL